MTEEDAATLVLVAESWLRMQARDGNPPPGEHVRRAFAAIALESPLTAAHCPALLSFTGLAGVANPQFSALSTGVQHSNKPRWLTVEQAGELLDLKPNSVRWLLRQGKLTGRRSGASWLVSSRSIAAYTPRRTNRAA